LGNLILKAEVEPYALPSTPAMVVKEPKEYAGDLLTYMYGTIENAGTIVASVNPASDTVITAGYARFEFVHPGYAIVASVNSASDTDVPRDSWPKDTLHDAARQVVKGAKDLVPQARQAIRDAADKASAPPTGRAAQDGALGRALGSRHTSYGLITRV
jgi:hypothetical protein